MLTEIIRYNIHDRGRTFTGKKRNFDSASLAEMINSPEIQEKVKNRDLVGYLGHWPRVRYGLQPPESVIEGGKIAVLESAFVTTHLRMDADGNIEHQADTSDNVSGKSIDDAIASKKGGFSSVVDTRPRGGKDVAVGFYGFDYVRDPNFTTNRPYGLVLDSSDDQEDEIRTLMDSAVAEYSAALVDVHMLYGSLNGDHLRALQVITQLQAENNDLIGRLASGGVQYDSTSGFIRPLRTEAADKVLKRFESFRGETLVAFDSVRDDEAERALERTRENARGLLRR